MVELFVSQGQNRLVHDCQDVALRA